MRPGSLGARFFGFGALLLILFLAVGFLLPARWEVERTRTIDASPEAVYRLLAAPEGWRAWTSWPDSGVTAEGPAEGAGATLSWESVELGSGTFRIVEARPDSLVRYAVDVQDGALRTEGSLALRADDGGTHVSWREAGDFGHNPLMGYWALFMEKAQGREMERSLANLAEAATAAAAPRR